MAYFSALGLGGTVFPGALWAVAQEAGAITKDMLANAEAVAGLEFTDAERELMLDGLGNNLEAFERLRTVPIPNSTPPALLFDPLLPGRRPAIARRPRRPSRRPAVRRPERLEDVAFWSITELSELIRSRQVSSVELTHMYLDRLKRHGPKLECVITPTEDLALRQAARADADLARGVYRSPLHGIPWGAKDLLAEDAYRTTWGAKPFEEQVIPYDATVVTRLEDAGAVLVAKLTLGALAMGDVWYGGRTRNPWNLEQGSSGSSAGSASATVAGLVGFSIGSETLGSIVSPSTRCGATGLRPTFGRVSRHGAMALSWSMDKIGPIARTVEDCALVFDAIHGPDRRDPTAVDRSFVWPSRRDPRRLAVGWVPELFERDRRPEVEQDDEEDGAQRLQEWRELDMQTLEVLRQLGVELVPMRLPDSLPVDDLALILTAEAATAFDELTRSGKDDLLVRQIEDAWPNVFRQGQLIPAVEYIRANRVRTLLMRQMEEALGELDAYVCPSFVGSNLLLTNLTGHPAVVVPNGFDSRGAPTSITFMGRLYGEEAALALAHAYQQATDFHRRRPPLPV